MRLPSTNPITLPFGATTDPYTPSHPHRGTDFSYLPDDTIYAPVAGQVILRPDNGNDGNGVYMNSSPYFIGMLHTSKYLVSNGETVKAGQPLAVMGSTGLAYGKHLHFAVKLNGVFVDPMKEIQMDHPYNHGDAVNIANLIGYDVIVMAGKVDWNDAYYSSIQPYIEQLKAELAQLSQPAQLTPGIYKVS